MKIKCPAFNAGESIPKTFTCDGANTSPQLLFEDIPTKTKSLALILDDPDAPVGLFTHWTLWNISPEIREISENSIPSGAILGMTSFGELGYGGPCPYDGEHRYYFTLYALSERPALSNGASIVRLREIIEKSLIKKVGLMGKYKRIVNASKENKI